MSRGANCNPILTGVMYHEHLQWGIGDAEMKKRTGGSPGLSTVHSLYSAWSRNMALPNMLCLLPRSCSFYFIFSKTFENKNICLRNVWNSMELWKDFDLWLDELCIALIQLKRLIVCWKRLTCLPTVAWTCVVVAGKSWTAGNSGVCQVAAGDPQTAGCQCCTGLHRPCGQAARLPQHLAD